MTRVHSEIWTRLASQSVQGESIAARPAIPDASERLLAGVDRQGHRHLLIELGAREAEYEDKRSRGVEISTRELVLQDGRGGRYLNLTCRDRMGFDVFDSLGGDLAAALAAGVEEPAGAVKRLVGKWRRFWLGDAAPFLSREGQIGLFAELWFLCYWLIPKIGAVRATEAWRGPLGSRHDIELTEYSVEIKATTSGVSRTHWIHGIDQLDSPESGPLFLFSMVLREEAGSHNTLATVVERMRDLPGMDDETIVHFEARLAQAGYSSVAHDQLVRLRVVDERLYRVEDPFPRLGRDSFPRGLPPGVEDVRYSINLAGCDSLVAAAKPQEFLLERE